MKWILTLCCASMMLFSCTVITSTNSPGKEQSKIPTFMQGKYELIYPESFGSIMGEQKVFIEIKENGLSIDDPEKATFIALNDSLSISKWKKEYFLNFGEKPELSVYKVVKTNEGLELIGLNAVSNTTEEQLKPYFATVKQVVHKDEDTGESEEADVTFNVTIDAKKLKKYYSSDLISKETIGLKRISTTN